MKGPVSERSQNTLDDHLGRQSKNNISVLEKYRCSTRTKEKV